MTRIRFQFAALTLDAELRDTPTARAIADERHRFMVEFFDRLAREMHGEA